MNIPNILTVFRILLTILFLVLIHQSNLTTLIVAAMIFWLASFTDFFDGYIARRRNLMSNFGKIMDPIADKFLILSAFFIFTQMKFVAIWMFVVIAIREVAITLWRLWALTKGKTLAAEKLGKIKAVLQMVLLSLCLIDIILMEYYTRCIFTRDCFLSVSLLHISILGGIILILLYVVVFVTVFSGVTFFWNNRRLRHVG